MKGRFIVAAACAAVTLVGAGTAAALAGGSSSPPPKPLDQAIEQAVSADHVGTSADVTVSGVVSGSGHLWISDGDQGRVDLQTNIGELSAAWDSTTLSVYVGPLNHVYRMSLPQPENTSQPLTLAAIDRVLAQLGQAWTISQPQPGVVAGQPAYTVSVSPKKSGSPLGSVDVTWDAGHGTPLRAAVYARGASKPAIELDVTNIVYGPVSGSDLQANFPATATVIEL
jgi:hypothetical protein